MCMYYTTFKMRSAYHPYEESGPGMSWLPWQQAPERREVGPSVLGAHLNFCCVQDVQEALTWCGPSVLNFPIPELFKISFHHKLPSLWYSVIPEKKNAEVPVCTIPAVTWQSCTFHDSQGRVEGDWGPWPPCCGFAVLLLLFSSLREITKEQKRSHLVVTTFKNSLHILWNTNQLQ